MSSRKVAIEVYRRRKRRLRGMDSPLLCITKSANRTQLADKLHELVCNYCIYKAAAIPEGLIPSLSLVTSGTNLALASKPNSLGACSQSSTNPAHSQPTWFVNLSRRYQTAVLVLFMCRQLGRWRQAGSDSEGASCMIFMMLMLMMD